MFSNTLGRTLIAATAFLALNSMANTLPAAQLKEMMSVKMMDTNKDGMVSRAEFVDMMGKIYDMKAKEMGAKNGMLDAAQVDAVWRALLAASGGQ